jgi:hypothetical protein
MLFNLIFKNNIKQYFIERICIRIYIHTSLSVYICVCVSDICVEEGQRTISKKVIMVYPFSPWPFLKPVTLCLCPINLIFYEIKSIKNVASLEYVSACVLNEGSASYKLQIISVHHQFVTLICWHTVVLVILQCWLVTIDWTIYG